ncbi:MAG: hypothetical protein II119_01835 [Bacilli bacterium]|nr:hypothetical protein [Bacilli bacterium]MBQ6282470.1 hypothetical protein [Bacilli bacterium]
MKKIILSIVVVLIILLIIPIGIIRLKDGGSTIYKGLIYNITKVHALNENIPGGYEKGLRVEIFGMQIYNKTNRVYKSIDKLEGPITLVLKSGTLTNERATFIIENNSEDTYTYGPDYYIEKYENNTWKEIKLDTPLTWNSIIITLKPNEKKEINIDFTFGYGKLNNGKYRLVKKVFKNDITMYINAEFIISDKKEVLKLKSRQVLNIELEPNEPNIKKENFKYLNLPEIKEKQYDNDINLKVFTNYINKTFNIKIDSKWKVFVHYYDVNKTVGMVEFYYTIENIDTNKSIIFNLNNGIVDIVYYKYLDKKVDEKELLNRIKIFSNKYVQEKKVLKNDEKFYDEATKYVYYYGVDKLVYSYQLFFKYGELGVINNDYGTTYIINKDGSIGDK